MVVVVGGEASFATAEERLVVGREKSQVAAVTAVRGDLGSGHGGESLS